MPTILIKNKKFITAALFFCGSANAVTIETVAVTANRIAKPLSEHSVSISIIDQQLAQIGHTHISEVLAQVPGVWISRGNGQEHLTAIRSPVLTGAGSCGAFHFAEDNIPLRAPGFCNVNALFDVNSEQAERIEVIRGAGTALHGSNAVNGVVNVISLPPSQQPSAALAIEVGAEDYQRLKFSRSETGGRHGYRLSVQGSKDRGYKDDAGFDQQKINLRHTYDGEIWQINSQLSASNLNQETASYILGENSYRDNAKQRENPNPEAFRDSHSVRYYSRFERDGSNNSHFVVTPYMRYTSMDFLQHFLPGTPLEENGERSAGVQTAFYQTISDATTIHHGFDLEVTDAYLQQTQANPGFAVFPNGKHYDYQVDGRYLAWFLGSEWEIRDGSVLDLDARYENQHYQYKNNMLSGNSAEDGSACSGSGCRYYRPDSGNDRFKNWSFHSGFIQDLWSANQLVLNANYGFRAPQASELYRLQTSQIAGGVDEEIFNSAEVGIRGSWPTFSYQLTSYYIKKDDLIFQDNNRVNVNGGKTLHRGIEASISWTILPTLNWALQGSYNKQQYDNDALAAQGNDIDTAPRRIASSTLNWQLHENTLLQFELNYLGEYFLDPANQHRYKGHNLINLRWKQQLSEKFYSVVRVRNLADKHYAERADFAFGNYRYFVGEPRSVFLEIGLDI